MAEWDSSGHRHGRWTGLFKLAEECGELVVAAVEVFTGAEDEEQPARVRALENELADVGAACRHAVEANDLDRDRVDARMLRQIGLLAGTVHELGRWHGLLMLVRACGGMNQLLGKIAAFPEGDEHPDGEGNLKGRLEVAVADLAAITLHVAAANGLDQDHIELRGDDKLDKFRTWFPAPEAEAVE